MRVSRCLDYLKDCEYQLLGRFELGPISMSDTFMMSMDQTFTAIIFDCDGTLVDSAGAHLTAYNVALAHSGMAMSWDWYSSRLGIPARNLLSNFCCEQKLNLLLNDLVEAYDLAFRRELASIQEITAVANIARAYLGKVPLLLRQTGHTVTWKRA
jgi:beta-phosphoglucomutase-like phosphatase (HAD superfamily)